MSKDLAVLVPDASATDDKHLTDTQNAFDSVAADYDGPSGNNALIQRMRHTMMKTLVAAFPVGSRLLDLGCGTGIDAVALAQQGYSVLATDWSPRMVARAQDRAEAAGLCRSITVAHVGIQQLDRLAGEKIDGIYSNFGPLNCAPDLHKVASDCANLLQPGGRLIFSVIGRLCPWELVHYALRGRLGRASVRGTRGAAPVSLNSHTVWAYYYFPLEFYRAFAPQFELESYQALSLFLPPPYLVKFYERIPNLCERLGRIDDRVAALPLLRDMGDHFQIAMRRR